MIVIARLEALSALADSAQIHLTTGNNAELAAEALKIIGGQLDEVVEKLREDALPDVAKHPHGSAP